MAYKEFHIDQRYKLFGNFYHAPVEGQNSNPFLAAHRTFMVAASDAPTSFHLSKWNKLDALGIFAAHPNGDKLVPLHAHLVIPDNENEDENENESPYPLAVFIHGQATTYFGDNDQPIREVKSYRGYRYLQRYLAERGIASVSVNVNVVSFLGAGHPDYEPQERFQLALLTMAMLAQISGTPVTNEQPIFLKKSDDSLAPLQDALGLVPPFARRSSEAYLHALKTAIEGKLSFTSLGFMGHSRGGHTVQIINPFFKARTGSAPQFGTAGPSASLPALSIPNGAFNKLTGNVGNNSHSMHLHLYHHIMNLMAVIGSPTMASVKAIVSLQPSSKFVLIDSPTTFFLVIASSHDSDVQEGAFNSYDNANCPKAMVFSHGASHGRFNAIWRRLRYVRRQINQQLLCQSPIRMLSNRGHENLAKVTVANALLAGMLGESHRFLFFSGEMRAPSIGQDIERGWKYPFPFSSTPTIKVLDATAIRASNTSSSTAVTPVAISHLSSRNVSGHENYANDTPVKAFTHPASESMVIRIPITSADELVKRTHFSYRYTKEYDAHSSSARRNVDLRTYTLRLKNGASTIGTPIQGVDVPSLHHKAYPTKDHNGSACEEDTVVLMQTAEVPLSQFLTPGNHPVTDLNQVTTIEIQLHGNTGASGDTTWFFVDFVLSQRTLPAAPAGFVLP